MESGARLPSGPLSQSPPELERRAPEHEPIHPGSGRRSVLKRALGPLAAVGLALAKFAAQLKTLLLLLPKAKFLTTAGSMLVSIVAYQLLFGWVFSVGFVLLLLLHELGHVIQLRREGVKASAPMFIPFLGAVISAKSMGDDAAAEARVGLAGPVLGSIATLVPLGLWLATGEDLWRALAYIGFLINLFNLLPVLPLDGGRAMAALSPWVWFAGFAGLIALTIFFPNPILILVLLFGGMESWRRWKRRNTPEARAYNDIPTRTRVLVAATYLGLAALLAVGVAEIRGRDAHAGAGGDVVVRAGRIAGGGLDVAIVECRLIGGECSYYACMPSKALLRPAELLAEVKRVPGAAQAANGTLDVAAALARRDEVIHDRDYSSHVPWLEDKGISLFRGDGRLDGERRIMVGDDVLAARRAVVLATGSSAAMPPKRAPRSLIVLGGGFVGVEMAQAWRSLGSEVVLVEAMDRVLAPEEQF